MANCEHLEKKYPPRRGWKITTTHPGSELYHSGYTSDLLKQCPCCRSYPVFEEASSSDQGPEERAKVFIGICPKCELRTRKEGTLKESVIQWQRRDFSRNSIAMNRRPKLGSEEGIRDLCSKVISAAIDETIDIMKMEAACYENYNVALDRLENTIRILCCMWKPDFVEDVADLFIKVASELSREICTIADNVETEFNIHLNHRKTLNKLENFFRTSCFMWELDCDGLISDIRKYLYPDLPPAERIKIPLHLRDLYIGEDVRKEWNRKCTQKMNSSKQQSDADTAGSASPSSSSKTTPKMNTRKKT